MVGHKTVLESIRATVQARQPRPVGLRCDVGAVERQAIEGGYAYLPLIMR